MEGFGEDYEMREVLSKYPEYDTYDDDDLFDAYDSLVSRDDMDTERAQYLYQLLESKGYDPTVDNSRLRQNIFSDDTIADTRGEAETSFKENVDADDRGVKQ